MQIKLLESSQGNFIKGYIGH